MSINPLTYLDLDPELNREWILSTLLYLMPNGLMAAVITMQKRVKTYEGGERRAEEGVCSGGRWEWE